MEPIALVTGAARGIGAATARRLAARGYHVCVNFHSARSEAEAVGAAVREHGRRALVVQADVSRVEDCERLFRAIDEGLGPLTALVNNAGIVGPRVRLERLEPAALDRVLAVNVRGLILCTQQALRRMSRRHGGAGGAIVNVSSGAARIGNPGSGVHYAASKGAVDSFTIGIAQEVAREGVRVNAVSPGLTRTAMPEPAALAAAGELVPMGRAAEPEEVAEAICWLLGEQAAHVSGANLRVAGGRP